MGTKALKPRHIVTAMHLQEILEEICDVLNGFKSVNIDEYSKYSLCLSHYGKIEIQDNSKIDAVYCLNLRNFYHLFVDSNNQSKIQNRFIDFQRCIVFTKQMICESMYDWDYWGKCSYGEAYPMEDRVDHWLNDSEHAMRVINAYKWIGPYWKIAHNELFLLLDDIQRETEIYGIHFSFLKEFLLEKIYNIKGYMPKRYDPYRYNYKKIYSEQINDERIDELIEKGLELKKRLSPRIKKEMSDINLFTDLEVEEIVNHIINVYVSYHYYELGKEIILKIDIN